MAEEAETGFRSLSDLEEAAARSTRPDVWAYVQGGSGEERTLTANRAAFERLRLRPRMLRGIAEIDLRSQYLGQSVRVPWYIAPMAYQGDLCADGECATARAAANAGCLSIFSTLSSQSLEAIAEAAPWAPRWFQLYLQPELSGSLDLVHRAERAGYSAIVLTVDVPLLAVRDRQSTGGFAIDESRPLGNGPHVVPPARVPVAAQGRFHLRPPGSASWEVLDRLREATRLPLVVKGILRGDDAQRAVEHGARAVIVSNHGGRQLDGAVAAIDALPEVLTSVKGKAEVYVEGGVRRASDILAALALGANGVGIGRPVLWALLASGEPGVSQYLRLLTEELANVMALAGCRDVGDIGRDLLV